VQTANCKVKSQLFSLLHLHKDEPTAIYTFLYPRSMIYIPFFIYK
jgi:hypothetical protein